MAFSPYQNQYTWSSHDHTFNYPPRPCVAEPLNPIPHMDWVYKKEEPEMTTLEKIHKERKEAAERERIEKTYEALDALDLDEATEGTVLVFDVEDGTDVKTYAALRAGEKWWATGCTSPNGAHTEDLLAWMIRKNVDPSEVQRR